jgi:hypothetical protein
MIVPRKIKKHYAMKMYKGYGNKDPIFYILSLGGGEWSSSHPTLETLIPTR